MSWSYYCCLHFRWRSHWQELTSSSQSTPCCLSRVSVAVLQPPLWLWWMLHSFFFLHFVFLWSTCSRQTFSWAEQKLHSLYWSHCVSLHHRKSLAALGESEHSVCFFHIYSNTGWRASTLWLLNAFKNHVGRLSYVCFVQWNGTDVVWTLTPDSSETQEANYVSTWKSQITEN